MNAQHEAFVRVQAMLEQIQRFGAVDIIPLSDYPDAATFEFLLPGNRWSFSEWKAVNTEVFRQLEARGFRVQLVPIDLNEYFDFLARYNLKNTPQNRAQFVSWKIVPEGSKPDPIRD